MHVRCGASALGRTRRSEPVVPGPRVWCCNREGRDKAAESIPSASKFWWHAMPSGSDRLGASAGLRTGAGRSRGPLLARLPSGSPPASHRRRGRIFRDPPRWFSGTLVLNPSPPCWRSVSTRRPAPRCACQQALFRRESPRNVLPQESPGAQHAEPIHLRSMVVWAV